MLYVIGGKELLDAEAILKRLGVKEGSRVGHLGCGGSGYFTVTAARLAGENATVYAVDILKSILETLMTKIRLEGVKNVKPVWSNLEVVGATRIPEESLDFALLVNILFESRKQGQIIKESARLIKPGGSLLVIDWDKHTTSTFGPPQDLRVSPAEIQKMAENCNLRLRENFQAGSYHFGLIFDK